MSLRSLSQLILLLLTTPTGQESSRAARHLWRERGARREGKGRREEMAGRREGMAREAAALVFSCVCSVSVSVYVGDFACLCVFFGDVTASCKYCTTREHTPAFCCLPGLFYSAPRLALSPSTFLWPQWLILTRAARASNQPRTSCKTRQVCVSGCSDGETCGKEREMPGELLQKPFSSPKHKPLC